MSALTKHLLSLHLLAMLPLSVGSSATEPDSSMWLKALEAARTQGLDSAFISTIASSSQAGFVAKTIRINVTNYSSTPDYSWSWNDASVATVKAFMKENKKVLRSVHRKYGVAKEVVASILWIETRCGTVTGTYHVPSVYLSLLLAADSSNVEQSVQRVLTNLGLDSTKADSIRFLVQQRAQRKSAWALKELNALGKIHQRNVMDVVNLKGSWAGAFGYPQFLPTTTGLLMEMVTHESTSTPWLTPRIQLGTISSRTAGALQRKNNGKRCTTTTTAMHT